MKFCGRGSLFRDGRLPGAADYAAAGNRPAGMEMTGVLRGFLLRLERELNPASEYVSADGFSEESFVLRRRHGTALNRTGTAGLPDFRESVPQTEQAGES